MSDDQRIFKIAKMKDASVIYPHPVKKGDKYLIRPNHLLGDTQLETLVSALNEGFLSTQKENSSFYQEVETHKDGQTPIYELVIEKLHFNFLDNKDSDLKKGEAIEMILSKKLTALILADTPKETLEAFDEFKKRFEAQNQCSTCQEMGIRSPKLQNWIKKMSIALGQKEYL